MKRPSGFTLLEALVALAILGILLAIAAPPLAGWHRRHAAVAAAASLRADLARARAAAIVRGETVTFAVDTAGRAWVAVAGADTVLARRVPRGLLLATTASRGRIPFTARGTSALYATTWLEAEGVPAAPRHGARVAPTGAIERW